MPADVRSKETFKQKKEEVYSRFDARCRRLLSDFLRQKNKEVCAVCCESCSDGVKIKHALRYLIEELTLASVKRCIDKADILVCLMSPYFSSVHMFESLPKRGKTAKALAKELVRGKENLLEILAGCKSEGKH